MSKIGGIGGGLPGLSGLSNLTGLGGGGAAPGGMSGGFPSLGGLKDSISSLGGGSGSKGGGLSDLGSSIESQVRSLLPGADGAAPGSHAAKGHAGKSHSGKSEGAKGSGAQGGGIAPENSAAPAAGSAPASGAQTADGSAQGPDQLGQGTAGGLQDTLSKVFSGLQGLTGNAGGTTNTGQLASEAAMQAPSVYGPDEGQQSGATLAADPQQWAEQLVSSLLSSLGSQMGGLA